MQIQRMKAVQHGGTWIWERGRQSERCGLQTDRAVMEAAVSALGEQGYDEGCGKYSGWIAK